MDRSLLSFVCLFSGCVGLLMGAALAYDCRAARGLGRGHSLVGLEQPGRLNLERLTVESRLDCIQNDSDA